MAAEGGHFVDFAYKWPRSGHFDWKKILGGTIAIVPPKLFFHFFFLSKWPLFNRLSVFPCIFPILEQCKMGFGQFYLDMEMYGTI